MAQGGLSEGDNGPNVCTPLEPLTTPSLPAASNEWEYTGARHRGPSGVFSTIEATSDEENVALSSKFLLPVVNGPHRRPQAAQESIRSIAERGPPPDNRFSGRPARQARQ